MAWTLLNGTRQTLDILIFTKRIKEWKGDEGNCPLCKTFAAQDGLLNLSCFYLHSAFDCKYASYVSHALEISFIIKFIKNYCSLHLIIVIL